jgi:hypothetical protein
VGQWNQGKCGEAVVGGLGAGRELFPSHKVVVSRHDDYVNDLGISGYQCFRWVAV